MESMEALKRTLVRLTFTLNNPDYAFKAKNVQNVLGVALEERLQEQEWDQDISWKSDL